MTRRAHRVTNLELASFLELIPVALALQGAARSKEDVLVVAVDVLNPVRQPGYRIVVHDFLPLARHVRYWDGNIFADVDGDVFRTHSKL